MNSLLLTYMNNGILVSILVLLLFAVQKKLKRHLSNNCLYLCCIVLLLAYLIPFRPFARNSLFIIMTQRVNKEVTESIHQYGLTDSNLHIPNLEAKTPSFDRTTYNCPKFVPKNHKLFQKYFITCKQQFNAFGSFLNNLLYNNLLLLNVICFLGVFITFGYHLKKYYRQYNTMKRITTPLNDQAKLRLFHKNQQLLKVSDSITCRTCSSIGSPITVGVLHPIIILPTYTFTEKELNYILRHELVHIKRKDILLQWLLLICLSLHWYNPILYLFVRVWKEFCESSCDSIVLTKATPTERMEYSKVLLKTALHQNQIHQLLLINFYGGKKRMKTRLQSILDTNHKKTSILTIMALAFIICSTSIFSFAKENAITTTDSYTIANQIVTSADLSKVVTNDITLLETSTDENTVTFSLEDFIAEVKTYEGARYVWGGNTPETGFDTSGFTQYIYSLYGYTLPRTSNEQSNSFPTIAKEDLQPGDLIFYDNSEQVVNHVAIYLGDDQVIHASNPKTGVKISSIDYRPIHSIGRVLQQ